MLLFFFNDTATTEIYTLSLHDALPICDSRLRAGTSNDPGCLAACSNIPNPQLYGSGHGPACAWLHLQQISGKNQRVALATRALHFRSEEHTSELQSLTNLVCRLLLEKK